VLGLGRVARFFRGGAASAFRSANRREDDRHMYLGLGFCVRFRVALDSEKRDTLKDVYTYGSYSLANLTCVIESGAPVSQISLIPFWNREYFSNSLFILLRSARQP